MQWKGGRHHLIAAPESQPQPTTCMLGRSRSRQTGAGAHPKLSLSPVRCEAHTPRAASKLELCHGQQQPWDFAGTELSGQEDIGPEKRKSKILNMHFSVLLNNLVFMYFPLLPVLFLPLCFLLWHLSCSFEHTPRRVLTVTLTWQDSKHKQGTEERPQCQGPS